MFGKKKQVYNTYEYRDRAKRILPKGLFEFIDRGAEDDVAVRNNRSKFEPIKLIPRYLVDVSKIDPSIDIFGGRIPFPAAVAPTGAAGLVWHHGEIALARAAATEGVPFSLATGSLTKLERVAEESDGRLWFQLYMWPDKSLSHALVERAKAAGYEALIFTVDIPVAPNREFNIHNGFTMPFKFSARNVTDVVRHPVWLSNVLLRYFLGGGMPRYENYPPQMRQSIMSRSAAGGMPLANSLTWDDLRSLRKLWSGPLMVKGILHPEDAVRAIECGADAVIISNHGGRNLDSAIAPMDALPRVADIVKGRVPIILDGGIMRGSDIVKAVAVGASMVMVGRSVLYGTAVAGEAGATRVISLLRQETERVMGQIGCPQVGDLSPGILLHEERPSSDQFTQPGG